MSKIRLIEKTENGDYVHNVTIFELRYIINDIRFNGLNYIFNGVTYDYINDTYYIIIQYVDYAIRSAVGIDKYIHLRG